MKIEMTKDEFKILRKTIMNIENDSVTKGFNSIFSNQIPGMSTSVENNVMVLIIDEDTTTKVGRIFERHSCYGGKLLGNGIGAIPKFISFFKGVGSDLKKEFSKD